MHKVTSITFLNSLCCCISFGIPGCFIPNSLYSGVRFGNLFMFLLYICCSHMLGSSFGCFGHNISTIVKFSKCLCRVLNINY